MEAFYKTGSVFTMWPRLSALVLTVIVRVFYPQAISTTEIQILI